MTVRTPDTLSAPIQALCRQINPAVQPRYLLITPEPGCEANDCFECVRHKVAREGGRMVFGWSIWEWPRIYVEAIHHAVYDLRLTPRGWTSPPSAGPAIRQRLFLPDDSAVYDFDQEGVLRDNQRLALSDNSLVQELFETAARRVALLNSVPGVGAVELDPETAQRLTDVEEEQRRLVYQLGMQYTGQNAPCFCGSGQKFKRCHGQPRRGGRG